MCQWDVRESLDAPHMVYWNRNSCKKPFPSRQKVVCLCVNTYIMYVYMMCLHLSLELVGLSGKSSGLGLRKLLELRMGFPTSSPKAVCTFYAFSKDHHRPQVFAKGCRWEVARQIKSKSFPQQTTDRS